MSTFEFFQTVTTYIFDRPKQKHILPPCLFWSPLSLSINHKFTSSAYSGHTLYRPFQLYSGTVIALPLLFFINRNIPSATPIRNSTKAIKPTEELISRLRTTGIINAGDMNSKPHKKTGPICLFLALCSVLQYGQRSSKKYESSVLTLNGAE